MSENITILFYFTLYFLVFGAPLYLLYKSRAIIRTASMKYVAKRFNLNYNKSNSGPLFELDYTGKRKINIISGKINGQNVTVYDYLIYRPFSHLVNHAHHTVLMNDKSKNDKTGFFHGFFRVSIKQIVNFLQELESKK